jgi:hypothetical protein
MKFIEKLKNAFATPVNKPQNIGISKNDKFLGKKKARKFLGRNRTDKNKTKSKRKNNYKTANARKILASRHGIANATRKNENKYVLTYGDISKLMRKFHYVFNKSLGKWLEKSPSDKKKDDVEKNDKKDVVKKPEVHQGTIHSDGKDDEEKPEKHIDKKPIIAPIDYNIPDKKKKKDSKKDDLKALQGRVILVSMGEEVCSNYEIESDDNIQFTVPDEAILTEMSEKGLLWLKKKEKWVKMDGKDPNLIEGYKGTLGRSILINLGEYSFLDFESNNLEHVEEEMENNGYEWIEGTWVNTEEKEEVVEAAGTSSTPAASSGFNSQGISPFSAKLGDMMKRKHFSEQELI